MNKLLSKISDAELEIMQVLWEAENELPISEIRKKLEMTLSWDSSTIKTLLRRLCEKGVVKAEKRDVFYYKPVVSKKDFCEYKTKNLIERLYSGSAKNLVASLIGSNKLNQSDIEELKSMFKVGKSDE